MTPLKALKQNQLARYLKDGYLTIDPFLDESTRLRLISALESVVTDKTQNLLKDEGGFNLEKKRKEGDTPFAGEAVGPGVLRKIQEVTDYVPEMNALMKSSKLLDLAEDLIGPRIYYHSSKLIFKLAHHGSRKPWHQDAAYWIPQKPEQVTFWMALDEAGVENGCLEILPGSHRRGLLPHAGGELHVGPEAVAGEKPVQVPVKPGGLVAFHPLTLHTSAPNTSNQDRRALLITYDPNPQGKPGEIPLRI